MACKLAPFQVRASVSRALCAVHPVRFLCGGDTRWGGRPCAGQAAMHDRGEKQGRERTEYGTLVATENKWLLGDEGSQRWTIPRRVGSGERGRVSDARRSCIFFALSWPQTA